MNYLTSLSLVVVIAALVAGAWRWLAKPAPIVLTSPAVARDVFQVLLTNGANGARLRLQIADNPAIRMDFIKYIRAHGDVGLRAVIESTAETQEAFDPIEASPASANDALLVGPRRHDD
jgi:hypothetical protein